MKEIIRSGSEYKNLATEFTIIKKAIIYNENNDILLYEKEEKGGYRYTIPSIISSNENEFYSYINESIGIPIDHMDFLLRIVDYNFTFDKINNKLKKRYKQELRDYYFGYVACLQEEQISPISFQNQLEVGYPKIFSLDDAIERVSAYNQNSRTGEALYEFQKIKRRDRNVR